MTTYQQLVNDICARQEVTADEIDQLYSFVYRNHKPTLDDVRELTNVYVGLRQPSDKFDKFFFGALKKIILEDGVVNPAEQFYLLKLLYSDRNVRQVELQFLRELKREARVTTPEFDALCQQAFQVSGSTWDVGGAPGMATV